MQTYIKNSLRYCVFAVIFALCLTAVSCHTVREKAEVAPVSAESEERVQRFLVLGCDRAVGLTDSILLVTLKEPENRLCVLQIPRDTYANYTERDYKKLNGAYQSLGMDGLKKFLSDALGVSIDYTVAMDLDFVSTLVDAIGGVDVDISQDLSNEEISLPAGHAHLDGKTAEYFVRYRKGYVNADLGRMDAQKQFVSGLTEGAKKLSPADRLRLTLQLVPKLQTDLPVQEAIRLTGVLSSVTLSEGDMATAPGVPVQGTSGAWYYSLQRTKMIDAINRYLLPESPADESTFDRERVFDRTDHPAFHKIYTAQTSG